MYAFPKSRMYGLGGNLCQWLKDKVAQVHQRVGDGEARCINDHVAIEQYVNVYGTVVVYAAGGFYCASKFAFNPLGSVEQFQWCQFCLECDSTVEECVVAVKAPWCGFNERGVCSARTKRER